MVYIPDELLYRPNPSASCRSNWRRLSTIDRRAKAQGRILGRFLVESGIPYQIVAVGRNTVLLEALSDFGVRPSCETRVEVGRRYAQEQLQSRDRALSFWSFL